jgi:mono/diheme cytochrome c family protein
MSLLRHSGTMNRPVSAWARRALIGCAVIISGLCIVRHQSPAKEPAPPAQPAADDAKAAEFFESRVRPLLVERCVECHGPEKQKSNLRLDSLAAILKGGDSGPALVPGKPEESLLVEVLGYSSDIKMPPKSKLPPREIADVTQWIKRGAHWPNAKPPVPDKPGKPASPQITDEQRAFWAFRPPVDPEIPSVAQREWAQSPIDLFVLARLEAAGLQPAPPADKRTLIRRATFDLIGLPPSPAEVAAFLADESNSAFARVVDRLLASPQYGERWGRHWLDVARYADSNGLDENLAYASAWRYRDYVIAAFNHDKPFNRFLQEQIAGDLLPPESSGGPFDGLIATGFLCLGAKMLAEDDPVKMQMDIIDEQVDTIGRAFLGLTLGCARCHSHKFDPIPTEDYYALAGIFKSTKTMENFSVVARWQERPLATPDVLQQQQLVQQQIDSKQAELKELTSAADARLVREARAHAGEYLLAAVEQIDQTALLKDTKPVGADPQAARDRGALVIEAENYTRGNTLKDTTNYGKEIGVILNQGELPNVAEYDVPIEAAGMYQLEIRYAAAGARPVELLINGETVKTDAAGKTTGSWNPDTQTWEVVGFFPLRSGANTIRLQRDQPFPHIDKLLLVPARDATGKPLPVPAVADGAYRPRPDFVHQWVNTLEKSSADPQSPLHVLHAFRRDSRLPGAETSPLASRFADLQPQSWRDVARRYGELLAEVDRASTARDANATAPQEAAPADAALESLRKLLDDAQGPLAVPKNAGNLYSAEDQAQVARLRDDVKQLQSTLPKLPETMAVSEGTVEDLRVHLRGSHLTLGEQVPRGFLSVLSDENRLKSESSGSGRRELADWLTRPDHPLTSRVIVNRVWLWHFGEGIVRSPDNFGALWERPTHPELLDWLALRFVEQGWSLKSLHRIIMNSAAYRMSTAWNDRSAQVDPENRLWWRANRRRLEAEELRDGLLAVCGELDPSMGGSMLPTANRAYVTGTGSKLPPKLYESSRRSIYLPVVRSALYEMFQAFDFADPSVINGRREATTVAPQALFMMNSTEVARGTRAWAQRLLEQSYPDDSARVQAIYERAYARRAAEAEVVRALQFVNDYQAGQIARETAPDEARLHAWQSLCRAVLSANEFVFVE